MVGVLLVSPIISQYSCLLRRGFGCKPIESRPRSGPGNAQLPFAEMDVFDFPQWVLNGIYLY